MEYEHSLAGTLIAGCHESARRWRCGGSAGEERKLVREKRRERRNKKRLSDLFCFEGSEGPAKMRKEVVNESNSIVQYRI